MPSTAHALSAAKQRDLKKTAAAIEKSANKNNIGHKNDEEALQCVNNGGSNGEVENEEESIVGAGAEEKEPKEDTAEAFAKEVLGIVNDQSPEPVVEVKLRNKNKIQLARQEKKMQDKIGQNGDDSNGDKETKQNGNSQQNGHSGINADTAALLHRTMEALYEINPDLEDSHEEIRKLDSQLDHLNEYMDKVEERIKAHNDKLMETLKQQKEEREKRRQSFHERLEINRQEEEDFQKQLNSVLNRVDSLRQSFIEEDGNAAEKDEEKNELGGKE